MPSVVPLHRAHVDLVRTGRPQQSGRLGRLAARDHQPRPGSVRHAHVRAFCDCCPLSISFYFCELKSVDQKKDMIVERVLISTFVFLICFYL